MEAQIKNDSLAIMPGLADLTKKQLTVKAGEIASSVHDEGGDVLNLIATASKVKHFATELEKQAKSRSISDLEKFDKSGTAKQGVQLKLKESGVKYDYSADQKWQRLNAELNAAKVKLAEWEKFLDGVPYEGLPVPDDETGEIYTARRPVRTASTTIEATIL